MMGESPGCLGGTWTKIKSLGTSRSKRPVKSQESSELVESVRPEQNGVHTDQRRVSHTMSRMSTASSNPSFYTVNDQVELESRLPSNRLDEQSLAELDEYGAEVDRKRALQQFKGGGTSSSSLNFRAPDLPAVPETEARLQQNGSASHSAADGAYPSGDRGEFLKACDTAVLKMLNKIHGSEASCVAEAPLLDVAPWNRRPGYLGYLTADQQSCLDQMKRSFPGCKYWHTDHDMLRFLRAREFDLEKTKELYNKYVDQYRASNLETPYPVVRQTHGPFDMELFELFPERDPHVTAQLQKLKDYFLHTAIFNIDKEGRPVVYFRPASIVKNNMNKFVKLKYRIAFQSCANEGILHLMRMSSQKVGYHVENCTQILDLGGMSALQMLGHMRSEESQSEWQHNMDFQPEVLHKIYIINAPTGMSAVWKFASFFVPVATRSKVEVLGANYFSTIEKVVGKERMPSCYGGDLPFEWHQHRSNKELKN